VESVEKSIPLRLGPKIRQDFSTLSTALGNRAKNKGARFPHSHSDGGEPLAQDLARLPSAGAGEGLVLPKPST